MTNLANPQDLGERIEQLVQEYISAARASAQAAVKRAFAPAAGVRVRRPRQSRPVVSERSKVHRTPEQIAALGERLYEAVCKMPGETMAVLGPVVGATSEELNVPMTRLKRAGRLRSVGERKSTRYFPMASEGQRAST